MKMEVSKGAETERCQAVSEDLIGACMFLARRHGAKEVWRRLSEIMQLGSYSAKKASTMIVADAVGGWRPIASAPEDEHIILTTTGGHVGEALMLIDEDTGRRKWTWALGPVHPNHVPVAWQPMPTPIAEPTPPPTATAAALDDQPAMMEG